MNGDSHQSSSVAMIVASAGLFAVMSFEISSAVVARSSLGFQRLDPIFVLLNSVSGLNSLTSTKRTEQCEFSKNRKMLRDRKMDEGTAHTMDMARTLV